MKTIMKIWIFGVLLLGLFPVAALAKDTPELVPNPGMEEFFKHSVMRSFMRGIRWRDAFLWEKEKEQYLMKEGENAQISFDPADGRIIYFLGDKYVFSKSERVGLNLTETRYRHQNGISRIAFVHHAPPTSRRARSLQTKSTLEEMGFKITAYDNRNPQDVIVAGVKLHPDINITQYIVSRTFFNPPGETVYQVVFSIGIAVGTIPLRRGIYQAIKRTPSQVLMKDLSGFEGCVFGPECYNNHSEQ